MIKFRTGDIVILTDTGQIGRITTVYFSWDRTDDRDEVMYIIDVYGESYYRTSEDLKLWNNKQSYGN